MSAGGAPWILSPMARRIARGTSVFGLVAFVMAVYTFTPVVRRWFGSAIDIVYGFETIGLLAGMTVPGWMAYRHAPYLADARDREFLDQVLGQRNAILGLFGPWWYWLSEISTRVGPTRHG